ncbi:alpha/beta fold hydrolase [Streptomyces sp. NBC_01092]|uniref:alpha/beta fold hydrolase n=1 Tax=Streptomyces sp. NBC_01092 TaxID=2903748 RepID=UPI0038647B6E|nr:alpha/beta hydrolase [Streptomyces sp. NBC_01092]
MCDVAILIADQAPENYQSLGLGTALADLAADRARGIGFHTLSVTTYETNWRVLAIIEHLGGPVLSHTAHLRGMALLGVRPDARPTRPRHRASHPTLRTHMTHAPERSTVLADDGARLAVYTSGPRDPGATVLVTHGYMMSADVWRRQARELTALGWRVIRYDQRFHGNSTGGTERTTIRRLAADLGQILTHTITGGPLVLAGHSLGGMSIMALAATQPQVIAQFRPRVALISTSCTKIFRPGNRPLDWAKAASRAMYAYPTCRLPSLSDRVRRHLPVSHFWALKPSDEADPSTPPPCREAIHHTPTAPVAEFWRSMRTLDTSTSLAALNALGHRIEIVTGELDDMIPGTQTHQLARALPRARMHPPFQEPGIVCRRTNTGMPRSPRSWPACATPHALSTRRRRLYPM